MSWFARSLANSFMPDPDEDDGDDSKPAPAIAAAAEGGDASGTGSPTRGVKEDLSELTKTLTRQLWGVASFLAPPPQSPRHGDDDDDDDPPPPPLIGDSSFSSSSKRSRDTARSDPAVGEGADDVEEVSDLPRIAGIRSDFAEIGGRFRSGMSKLSSNKAVSEFSKIASTFLPFRAEGDEEEEAEEEGVGYRGGGGRGAIGVTEEVMTFARNISMHPETWLDFPLLPDEDDSDDFDMSDAQQEHALAVEHLAPRLAALRIELCPSHMSEGCFWKIYFVLLHPRLNKEDAERLSTPEITEARAMLLQELQNRSKSESYNRPGSTTSYRKASARPPLTGEQLTPSGGFCESIMFKKPAIEEPTTSVSTGLVTEKHPVITTEIKIVDKSVIEEELPNQDKGSSRGDSKVPIEKFEDDGDDWLEDEGTEIDGSGVTLIPIGNEEDVSFSDLEEEDDRITPASSQKESRTSSLQTKDSRDWIQLSNSSSKLPKDRKSSSENESNEWLDVEDIDLV